MSPSIGPSLVSRYPDLRALACADVSDPPPLNSRGWPSRGERIIRVLKSSPKPMSIQEVAEQLGTTSENLSSWFMDSSAEAGVVCVGKVKQTHKGKTAKLWAVGEKTT